MIPVKINMQGMLINMKGNISCIPNRQPPRPFMIMTAKLPHIVNMPNKAAALLPLDFDRPIKIIVRFVTKPGALNEKNTPTPKSIRK